MKNVSRHAARRGQLGVLPGAGQRSLQARQGQAGEDLDDPGERGHRHTAQARREGRQAPGDRRAGSAVHPVRRPDALNFPPDTVPVAVGPPAPPAPTLVRFERNVVALHGHARPRAQPARLRHAATHPHPRDGTAAPGASERPRGREQADRRTRRRPRILRDRRRGRATVRSGRRRMTREAAASAGDPKAGAATAEGRRTPAEAGRRRRRRGASSAISRSRRPTPPATSSGFSSASSRPRSAAAR